MRNITGEAYCGDIVSRLRNWRGLHLANSGELFEEAAAEIARLRLLPEERCAIERAASFLEGSGWSGVTLRGILGRLSEPAVTEVIPLAAEMPEPYEIDGDS